MKLSNFNEWFTLVSNIAVVAGILFLGIEINQTNELMEAEARYNALQIRTQTNLLIASEPQLAEILEVFDEGIRPLTGGERRQLISHTVRVIRNQEWMYSEIPIDDALLQTWKVISTSNSWQLGWQSVKPGLNAEFVTFVEQNII